MRKDIETKDTTLIARCTESEKERIQRKAKSLNKSQSEYILDCCMAGTERKSDKLKKLLVREIKVTEELNQLHYLIEKYEEKLPKKFKDEINEEIIRIGGVNRCQY